MSHKSRMNIKNPSHSFSTDMNGLDRLCSVNPVVSHLRQDYSALYASLQDDVREAYSKTNIFKFKVVQMGQVLQSEAFIYASGATQDVSPLRGALLNGQ